LNKQRMEFDIQLSAGPIAPSLPVMANGTAGAWVEFRGVVRGEENGAAIAAIEYEAYAPMAVQEMRRLLAQIAQQHPCLAARVIHRIGVIPVGETAIYVGIAGRHRAEAFALLGEFMDRLKVDVPIWKRRVIPAPAPVGSSPTKAASLDDVLAAVRAVVPPLPLERVPLAAAASRVLQETVRAKEDQPAFDRSAVDGFAVRIDDLAQRYTIVDRLRAGDWRPRALAPGQAVQIATGGALPGEDLQVVMKEDVRVDGDCIEIVRREATRYIRRRGEDCRAGDVLLDAGTWLTPGGVGLLASLGAAHPLVSRLPRVLHLVTGNEIVPPDQTPAPGQIRDSNSTLVRAFFMAWGIEPVQVRVGEDRAAIEAAIANSRLPIADCDVVVISGGASVGEHDFTRGLLEQSGFQVEISKAATRPGKPLILAHRGKTVAFGLPGNPLAHFVCLNLFVRAALERMLGLAQRPPFASAVLAVGLDGENNPRETLWPAVVRSEGGRMLATPLRWSSSGDLTCLATANALLRVPPAAGALLAGTEIPFATILVPA
jgi:molybdopterin molybdotransferase